MLGMRRRQRDSLSLSPLIPRIRARDMGLEPSDQEKKKQLSLETLFGDRDFTLPLANFIKASHRFSPQPHHDEQVSSPQPRTL